MNKHRLKNFNCLCEFQDSRLLVLCVPPGVTPKNYTFHPHSLLAYLCVRMYLRTKDYYFPINR